MSDDAKTPWFPAFCRYWLPPLMLAGALILITSGESFGAGHTKDWLHWVYIWPLSLIELDLLHRILRKVFHVVSYGALYLLWFRPLYFHQGLSLRKAALASLGLCLLVGLSDELAQSFTPGRKAQLVDVILDLGAASLAALAVGGLAHTRVWGKATRG